MQWCKDSLLYGTTETGGIAFDDSDDIDDSGTVRSCLPGVTLSLQDEAQRGRGPRSGWPASTCGAPRSRPGIPTGPVTASSVADFHRRLRGVDEQRRLTLLGRASSFVNVAGRKVHR